MKIISGNDLKLAPEHFNSWQHWQIQAKGELARTEINEEFLIFCLETSSKTFLYLKDFSKLQARIKNFVNKLIVLK